MALGTPTNSCLAHISKREICRPSFFYSMNETKTTNKRISVTNLVMNNVFFIFYM